MYSHLLKIIPITASNDDILTEFNIILRDKNREQDGKQNITEYINSGTDGRYPSLTRQSLPPTIAV